MQGNETFVKSFKNMFSTQSGEKELIKQSTLQTVSQEIHSSKIHLRSCQLETNIPLQNRCGKVTDHEDHDPQLAFLWREADH